MLARERVPGSTRSTYRTGYASLADPCDPALWQAFPTSSLRPFKNNPGSELGCGAASHNEALYSLLLIFLVGVFSNSSKMSLIFAIAA